VDEITTRKIGTYKEDRTNTGEDLLVEIEVNEEYNGGFVTIGDYTFDTKSFLSLADLVRFVTD